MNDRASRRAGWLALTGLVVAPFYWSGDGGADAHGTAAPAPARSDTGRVVVDLVDGSSAEDLDSVAARAGVALAWLDPRTEDEALAVGVASDPGAVIERLRGDPIVESVEAEIILSILGFPDDPLYEQQWNLRAIGAPAAWRGTPRGRGVVVAVIDTGVASVEDLSGTRLLAGASFVPGVTSAADDQGHGTHVAGTIAQTTNNAVGVAGIAPGASILPVKVLSASGSGQSAWIAAGIDWAVDEGADVINLSLGGGYSEVIHTAIRKARAQGVLVVAAVGNSGREGVNWPGALPEAIGVGAVGPSGDPAPYSSWGEGVDLVAPGGDKRQPNGGILQDTIDGRGGHAYLEFQGTSMATPHVAGAAAALLSTGLPASAVERLLLDTARGSGSWDAHLGRGQLDLGQAVLHLNTLWGATRAALAIALAGVIAWLGRSGSRYGAISAAVAGLTASGVFFLPNLSVGEGVWVAWASSGVLAWPVLVSPSLMHFPAWLAAGIPGGLALTLGAFRGSRAVAAGVCVGVGAHLLFGAATGSLEPWWLGRTLGGVWLGGNAALSLALALALAGTHHLELRK